ncbi:polysialyltransferase family glycosyltransferase [Petrotoga sp. Shatin.DS.tank11.9.2.9.3]|uniref:polysialyltransferase family glycosyltransferase n=1 Tax=Petrotoga sp. Shatin.DS.tank11.9.2.9.3 TaxID=1469556 RepID=UPI000EF1A502|nr:polysialyltransferase family glycosyltransferase [Petrotoga sp. Shatin.DS.tank11.9.2.9.3]RLL85229.1 hypothetical protein BZ25_02590 [Petrotoga sp. Shatin.DS.tank11.9.2.9.3]
MRNVIFMISAYYHNLLAESLAFVLSKKGVVCYSVYFEVPRYRFKESRVFKKSYRLERTNDRDFKKLFSLEIKDFIKDHVDSIKKILNNFSSENTVIITFTEYDISNFLFLKEAYNKDFKILLIEEGIGTYLVKNNYYKNIYSIFAEQKYREILNTKDLIVSSPWARSFLDVKKDLFFHFNSKFFKKFILNENIAIIENHEICDYRGKIVRKKLFNENEISDVKNYYLTEYSLYKTDRFQAIIYLNAFRNKKIFYNIYRSVLEILKFKGLSPVILKPHPLNDKVDHQIIKEISQEINISIYYFQENIPGEVLAFLNEEVRYIFSYGSTTSWFLKNFDQFNVFMLFRMFKRNNLYSSFQFLEKYIDFDKTTLLLPRNAFELADLLENKNTEKENTNNETLSSVSETIIKMLPSY